ncbi:substrate-binding domain-containing protein [Agathobaculum sp.]|uniref:substrate-binding domain-containing protein n=1 Tax=Agathobaculum sp. TaxID=2048138 RepID=UPI002A7F072F|nr:substrate-binding domain-containing protein [Agathobaculum sp.]MDY3618687.1 substrate-binding domain-containing protein [Agathobaculum sp.]
MKNKKGLLAALAALLILGGCGQGASDAQTPEAPEDTGTQAPEKQSIILATTTSTQDSGLLDVLLPEFTGETGIEVKIIAVGTGKAIQMGVDGEADVLLVHDTASELKFMDEGNGVERNQVMYNDFILVGPESDPAGIAASFGSDAAGALGKIAETASPFVSRADDSGTHKKELKLWGDLAHEGDWYIEAGAGMGDVLKMADEKQAYTISDRATYLAMQDDLDLAIVCEGDQNMFNQYGVMTVDPKKNDQINYDGAKAFYDWMISDATQNRIAEFGKDTYGQSLFTPNAKG